MKALQVHPDRLATASEEERRTGTARFQELAKAHEVLSDPRRRMIYDQLGDSGFEAMSSLGEVDPAAMMADMRVVCFVVGTLVLLLLCIISFPILLAVQLDAKRPELAMPWAAAFVPVWLLDVILCAAVFFSVRSALSPTLPRQLRVALALAAVAFVSFIVSTALICVALSASLPWPTALAPCVVAVVFATAAAAVEGAFSRTTWSAARAAARAATEDREPTPRQRPVQYPVWVAWRGAPAVVAVAQLAVLAAALQGRGEGGTPPWAWVYTFIPALLAVAVPLAISIATAVRVSSSVGKCAAIVGALPRIVAAAVPAVALGLLLARLDGGVAVPAAAILAPLFAVAALALCACCASCVLCCCAVRSPGQVDRV